MACGWYDNALVGGQAQNFITEKTECIRFQGISADIGLTKVKKMLASQAPEFIIEGLYKFAVGVDLLTVERQRYLGTFPPVELP